MPKTFRPQLRTKNHTAAPLRNTLGEFTVRCIIRLGSRISIADAYPRMPIGRPVIEVNTAEACHNSGDKILMKSLFQENEIKTAKWWMLNNPDILIAMDTYPAIIKHKNSCKGEGIFLINTQEELQDFILAHNTRDYIIEEYKNFQKEFRLHVTKDGCFYTCRKMLKADAEERWHRHDTNSVWIMEGNPLFEKPKNWDDMITESVKALNAVGLTIGAVDLKCQSEKGKRADFIPDFIILEINSAPGLAVNGLEAYRAELPKIIQSKINELQ